MRLLCIDDEPEIRSLIATVAQECGFEVESAANTAGIGETCSRFRPDVIVLDLVMRESDGIEGLAALAMRKSVARIILISGFPGDLLATATKHAKMYGLDIAGALAKPFRPHELRDLLRTQFRAASPGDAPYVTG